MLSGRGIVITGASRGLGLEIARTCVGHGADLLICSRQAGPLDAATDALRRSARPGQVVESVVADVSNGADVDRLVRHAVDVMPNLSGLVNNAGVYGPKGRLDDVEWESWWETLAINLGGTARVTGRMLPYVRPDGDGSGNGKIVTLSGGGATAPMPALSAYAASKAAIVRLTETLAVENLEDRVDINAVAPGTLDTDMLGELLEAGPERIGTDLHDKALAVRAEGGTPLSLAAGLVAFLLSSASDGLTGRLISAPWDPWTSLTDHLDDLRTSDIYTLRRIVPADRQREW